MSSGPEGGGGPPLVSVVLPFFNARRFLAEALDSILAQEFRDFELLAVDDGSQDGSVELVERYVLRDPRVRLVRGGRRGLPGALNLGIESMRGLYLARMDADDVALPQRFARQVAALQANANLVVVGGAVDLIDARGRVVGSAWYPVGDDLARRILGEGACPFCHPATMIRRDALAAAGGYRAECELAEDLDLWLRLAHVGALGNVDSKVLRYRVHRGSASYARLRTQVSSHYRALILNDPELPESAKMAAVQTREIWKLVLMCTAEGAAPARLVASTAWYIEQAVVAGGDRIARSLMRQVAAEIPSRYRAETVWRLGQHAVMAALSVGRTAGAWYHLALSVAALARRGMSSAEKRGIHALMAIARSRLRCETTGDAPPGRPASGGHLDFIQWQDGRRYLLIRGWIARRARDPEVGLLVHLARRSHRVSIRRVFRPDVAAVMGDEHLASGFVATLEFPEPVEEAAVRVCASVRYRSGAWHLLEDRSADLDVVGAGSMPRAEMRLPHSS